MLVGGSVHFSCLDLDLIQAASQESMPGRFEVRLMKVSCWIELAAGLVVSDAAKVRRPARGGQGVGVLTDG